MNGLNVKHLIGNFDNTTGIVEGIGRISNPCYPSIDAWGGLACYTKQSQTIQFSNIDCSAFPIPNRLGLKTVENNSNLNIYPNPATNIVTISNNNQNIESIKRYDLQGRILKTEQVNKSNTQLDISNYQSGTYYFVITTANGSSTKKIMKN